MRLHSFMTNDVNPDNLVALNTLDVGATFWNGRDYLLVTDCKPEFGDYDVVCVRLTDGDGLAGQHTEQAGTDMVLPKDLRVEEA